MRRIAILLFILSVVAPSLYAHHGRGATFDMNKRMTLKGTVSRVDWRNPHVVIWMDVKDQAGIVVPESSPWHAAAAANGSGQAGDERADWRYPGRAPRNCQCRQGLA